MQACKESGASAVHPGYGFLSESPEFVEAVEGAGLAWLGPRGNTMTDFALKHVAKKIATDAGVPIMEGSPLVASAAGAHAALKSSALEHRDIFSSVEDAAGAADVALSPLLHFEINRHRFSSSVMYDSKIKALNGVQKRFGGASAAPRSSTCCRRQCME